MEDLEIDITSLNEAHDCLYRALNELKDIDGIDEQYEELEIIADEIKNIRKNLERQLEQYEIDYSEAWAENEREDRQLEQLYNERVDLVYGI